jgi:hypothetical protein
LNEDNCYVAFTKDASYTLCPTLTIPKSWLFYKTVNGLNEGPGESLHVDDLPLWFEWLNVPYDASWHLTPADESIVAEAWKGVQS